MKKIQILSLAIIFTTFSAFGQTDQGKLLIGGSSNLGINFGTFKTEVNGNPFGEDQKFSSFNISPSIGYFVIDNLVTGLSLPISSNTNKFEDGKSTSNSLLISPFVRYYFTESNIKPFLQGRVGFGSNKNEFESNFGDNESKSNLFDFGISGGVAIFVNDIVAFNLGINYANSTSKPDNESDNDVKTTTSLFSFGAGISIIL